MTRSWIQNDLYNYIQDFLQLGATHMTSLQTNKITMNPATQLMTMVVVRESPNSSANQPPGPSLKIINK